MDFHCDGKVNYSEFLAATISSLNYNKEEKLWSAFKYFDTTDSGFITLDSVIEALKDSGVIIDEKGLGKTFSELKKKNEKINFDEFKEIAFGSQNEIKETVSSKKNNKIIININNGTNEYKDTIENPITSTVLKSFDENNNL